MLTELKCCLTVISPLCLSEAFFYRENISLVSQQLETVVHIQTDVYVHIQELEKHGRCSMAPLQLRAHLITID